MASSQTAPNPSTGVQEFSQQDLKDPTLFKLNSTFKLLWGKIANLYQYGMSVALGADLSAPSFTATNQSQPPPAGSNILLTRVSGDALYGPAAQRQAIVNATYQGTNVQPAPSSSGMGSAAAAIQEVALVHSTTKAISSTITATVGSMLAVFITQDSSGNGQITWNSSDFKGDPTVNIGVNANDVNTFLFLGRNDPATSTVKWFLVADPNLGQQ